MFRLKKRGFLCLCLVIFSLVISFSIFGASCSSWPCSCGDNITGSIIMNSDLSCNTTNLNIGSNNMIFDCAGHNLDYNLSNYYELESIIIFIDGSNYTSYSYGILNNNYNNVTIQNCNITAKGLTNFTGSGNYAILSGYYAILYYNGTTGTIKNNTFTINSTLSSALGIFSSEMMNLSQNRIITNNSGNWGISIALSNHSKISLNQINTSNTYSYGIISESNYNLTINNNLVSTVQSNSPGIYMYSYFTSNINLLIDSNLFSTRNSDAIYLENPTGDSQSILLNNNITSIYPYAEVFIPYYPSNHYLIYNNSYGEIRWTNNTFLQILDVDGTLGLGSVFLIGNNTIAINTTAFGGSPLINSNMNLTLRGMGMGEANAIKRLNYYSTNNTEILYYGTNCANCAIIEYNPITDEVKFNSTSLGSFTSQNTYLNLLAPFTYLINVNASTMWNNTNDNITCYVQGQDDNSTLTAYWEWYLNGTINRTGSSIISVGILSNVSTIYSNELTIGDNWTCSVKMSDGYFNESVWNNVSIIIINNSLSTEINFVNASSIYNYTVDNLTCYVSGDNGGINDTLVSYWEWYKNGILHSNGFTFITAGILNNVSSILSNETYVGDTWNCLTKLSDGSINESLWQNYSIYIRNPSCGNSVTFSFNLSENLSCSGNGINISSSNVVINGNGVSITGSNPNLNYGIYAFNVSNITIINLSISSFKYGIYIDLPIPKIESAYNFNSVIRNNLVNSTNEGIYLSFSKNSTITNNIIINNNETTNGITLYWSSNNNLFNNYLNNSLNITGYYSENNTFTNGKIGGHIYAEIGTSFLNNVNNITNVTFNKSKLNIGYGEYLYVKWPVQINVTNTSGEPIENITIYGYDILNNLDNSAKTNSWGLVTLNLTEFYITNNVFYYLTNNHLVKIEEPGYTQNQTSLNLINTTGASLNLSISPLYCGMNLGTNAILGSNMSSGETCFNLSSNNITIEGNGYSLIGNGTSIGILISGINNINITNLTFINYSSGISLLNVNSSILNNLHFINNTKGIMFNISNSNVIYNSLFSNNSINDIFAINDGGTNNSWVNTTINLSMINASSTATLYQKWYVIVNVTLNGVSPLQNANVTGYTNENEIEDSALTNSNGIAILELSELKVNSSGIYYLTPNNITVSYNSATENSTNSTLINLTQTNNTLVNLSLYLNCTVPSDDLLINGNVTFCPGTYNVIDSANNGALIINANNVNITCDNTQIVGNGNGKGIINSGYNSTIISSCYISNYSYNTYLYRSANNYIYNSSFNNGGLFGLYLYAINNTIINDSYFINNPYSLVTSFSTNITIINNIFNYSSGTFLDPLVNIINSTFNFGYNSLNDPITGLRLFGSNGNVYSNRFNTFYGIYFEGNSNNNIYYNNFTSQNLNYYTYPGSSGTSSFNTSLAGYAQGNQYDDFCGKGTDLNGDGYADASTTNTSNDWPYNSTTSSKFYGPGNDYGPKIHDCITEVQLGGSSSGGGSSSASPAESSTPATPTESIPTPRHTDKSVEVYSAEEAKQYLTTEKVQTSSKTSDITEIKITLSNTGTKKMSLFPGIIQDIDDPFFIVTKKTLGYEGSWFSRISKLAYSKNAVSGRLLKAEILNPEQIILNPGEKIEKTLELKEGLIAPRQVKIQFTTLGETVTEQEIKSTKKTLSGLAFDVDSQNNNLDMYLILVPEQLSETFQNYYANKTEQSLTGAAVTDIAPQTSNDYMVEISINKGKSSVFSELYGPYTPKQLQALVFAQQLVYDPLTYSGNYSIESRIYRGGKVVFEDSSEVDLK